MTNKLLCTYDAHAVFAVGDAALDLPAAASKCKVDSHQCIACTMCIIVQCCLRELPSFTHKLPTTAVLFCLNLTDYLFLYVADLSLVYKLFAADQLT